MSWPCFFSGLIGVVIGAAAVILGLMLCDARDCRRRPAGSFPAPPHPREIAARRTGA